MDRLTLVRPDDWHLHLRSGAMLRTVLPYTTRVFARAMVMPNVKPPLTTLAAVRAYRDEIRAAVPVGCSFEPLMTLYLTDHTVPDEVALGVDEKLLTAAKLYPAGATTNSENGVTDLWKIYPVLELMQKVGMPLSIHGEETGTDVDPFDREAVFIDQKLIPLRRDFPELKIVLEHVTTEYGTQFVAEEGCRSRLAATITAHHLVLNRGDLFDGGVRPHYYCLPIAKREKDRQAIVRAATSGDKMFFLGTDSAPHARAMKESAAGSAGIFTAFNAFAIYAHVFEEAGALSRLEAFASLNGAAFYGLLPNKETITLEKSAATLSVPEAIQIDGDQGHVVPFDLPLNIRWQIVSP